MNEPNQVFLIWAHKVMHDFHADKKGITQSIYLIKGPAID